MKKSKGFTLIELLAIIVILAIIAVITVPIILGIIDDAKKGTAKDSAYGYKDAVNKFYATELMSNRGFSMQDKIYSISELSLAGVDVSGNESEGDSWVSIQDNEVVSGCLQFGDYKVGIVDGKVEEAVKGECDISDSSSVTIVSGTKGSLQSGDVVKIGDTESFYVVSSDNSASGVTVLLAKYNLNVGYDITLEPRQFGPPSQVKTAIPTPAEIKQDSTFIGYSNGATNYKAADFSSGSYWMDTTTSPQSLKSDYSNNGLYVYDSSNYKFVNQSDNSIVYPYVYDSNSDIYSYINGVGGYLDYLKSNGAPSAIIGRLMYYEEAIDLGCIIGSSGCPDFMNETAFYLGAVSDATKKLEINRGGIDKTGNYLGGGIVSGIRPVIEISTSYIK